MAHERPLKGRRGKHTTLCEVGEELVKLLRRIPQINSWFPARIAGGFSRHKKITFQPTNTGLKAVVFGHGKKQDFYLVTKEPATVQNKIRKEGWT